ncbi:S8 family peptidase [Clostridium saccharobutylicum]|uniref:Peptidase S8 and S53, subtilisin, kexin, sedolisin n=1 Tax=Clostridium saccharobutylicum DSM 13864 TaxID=1345695 RepID=U5MMU5_CLOSA|nr:S8 family peptidase [Clostridium saccharobutylicum]AGX42129.1 peptidase S8 and S53, subtilisin, kexin, sedolisin [Clostridium saccharobutylicum DSM 13864]AQR89409.1 subtilase family protein [Clostridium saccharobutylicum]AQR99311.1 subtilase family protein [Clostridium saccharobutylicum]AQS09042.1 subtilase family protein [Clostridium saccharobutylicum]AQS13297.1 subtilase family protein [Clostridium saccharobutylicum]
MYNLRTCNLYYDPSVENYLIEYRGNFKEQIDKITYACGAIITDTIGIVAVSANDLDRLIKDVPTIVFVDFRPMFVLQDISPSYVDNINNIKMNPYLNLTGRNVLIGIVDTGIDYLNQEFIREDGTSRIASIWDQTIQNSNNESVYIGETYSNEQINAAINASKNNQDPYKIVPSKDVIGHGTNMAGIMGARGYTNKFQGVANDVEFVVVKLFESSNFRKMLEENNVTYAPVYNSSEIVAALEYLKNMFLKLNKPMVIYLGVGTTEGSHDSANLISRYLTSIGNFRGLCIVTGVGNEGAAQGHVSGYIKTKGDKKTSELKIPKELKYFSFNIWIQRPNRASINVISPTGESSNVIQSKIDAREIYNFVFTDTKMFVRYYTPEHFTGHEVIQIIFNDIKPGIWKIQLTGSYIVNGRYDIWLPPHNTLPENLVFLEPDPFNTLTIPGTVANAVTVAYYGTGNSLIASSGKGFNANNVINPDIATIGVNIITTKVSGGTTAVSGSSAATAIVAGACALLLEWGIINGNDTTMYSPKIVSYLIYGAYRNELYKFPNRETGYGDFDLLGVFNVISRLYRNNSRGIPIHTSHNLEDDKFIEYYVNKLFIRIPQNDFGGFFNGNEI